MTIGDIGHQPSPLKWINEGWAALKERAHSAITHFAPTDESETSSEEGRGGSGWGVLATDVLVREGEVEARFELPGIEKEDLEVSIRHDRIIVKGEKRVSDQFREGDVVVTERAFGRCQRAVVLPTTVQASEATAEYRNGVLTVKIPRTDHSSDDGKIVIK